MSSLKNIREKLGISQQEAADWLGISRSLAEHYERGTRSLPTHALLQLAKLEILIAEFEKQHGSLSTNHDGMETALQDKEPRHPVPLHPRKALALARAERLEHQLFVLKSRHNILQQRMLLIQHLIDNGKEQASEKEKCWLQMLYHGLNAGLSKFDETKQLPLKAKIMEMKLREDIHRH